MGLRRRGAGSERHVNGHVKVPTCGHEKYPPPWVSQAFVDGLPGRGSAVRTPAREIGCPSRWKRVLGRASFASTTRCAPQSTRPALRRSRIRQEPSRSGSTPAAPWHRSTGSPHTGRPRPSRAAGPRTTRPWSDLCSENDWSRRHPQLSAHGTSRIIRCLTIIRCESRAVEGDQAWAALPCDVVIAKLSALQFATLFGRVGFLWGILLV